ncbi:Ku70/Ku80 beta-barrel domain protein [Salinisphaera shabanensis E1L3A]|uniref:Ku70/Ku80 beta-barrel domain protein n=1 Tax=Salinisphaera shabanensis E1L3A TaxID=1033802 RepID=U2E5P8_9GAMM|nr:Ku protein [Salinisphaera shabanensis]ERJ19106.1 Ku70/Ku80 beta-barrel domain protein [Salinisphaera shabanensis E1L3A]
MPKQKQDDKDDKDYHEAEHHGPRPFWSGTITFGLVSLPVSLYVATRSKRVKLRMVDHDGEPLAKRYFCPAEEIALESDEIVRGYEVEKDQFVVVENEELDAIAPEKSQEIDLRRFVPVDQIDPMFFQRAYFLAPNQGAIKPYRLLAQSMEDSERAGIATCVIRGKEYLLAILSHQGILRAEILRFAEELRTPADIGLPESIDADNDLTKKMVKSIEANGRKTLDRDALTDVRSERIRERVDDKLEADEDVIHEAEDDDIEDADSDEEPVDLMAVLKQSLEQKSGDSGSDKHKKNNGKKRKSKPRKSKKKAQKKSGGDQPSTDMTRDELYDRAQQLDIPGRSRMTKEELAAAINDA